MFCCYVKTINHNFLKSNHVSQLRSRGHTCSMIEMQKNTITSSAHSTRVSEEGRSVHLLTFSYYITKCLHQRYCSDADAALYWLGRMLQGGEDPLYIARRLVRAASEDIGLADNTALPLVSRIQHDSNKDMGSV